MQATPTSIGTHNDFEDFRTPSAPPMFDIGGMGKRSEPESELSEDTTTLEEFKRDIDELQMPEKLSDNLHGNKEVSSKGRVQFSEHVHNERYTYLSMQLSDLRNQSYFLHKRQHN